MRCTYFSLFSISVNASRTSIMCFWAVKRLRLKLKFQIKLNARRRNRLNVLFAVVLVVVAEAAPSRLYVNGS